MVRLDDLKGLSNLNDSMICSVCPAQSVTLTLEKLLYSCVMVLEPEMETCLAHQIFIVFVLQGSGS